MTGFIFLILFICFWMLVFSIPPIITIIKAITNHPIITIFFYFFIFPIIF
jgi:hypothetical protein